MDNGEAQRAKEAKVVARVTPYQLGTLTSESFRVKMLVQHQRTEIIGFVWGPWAVEGPPRYPPAARPARTWTGYGSHSGVCSFEDSFRGALVSQTQAIRDHRSWITSTNHRSIPRKSEFVDLRLSTIPCALGCSLCPSRRRRYSVGAGAKRGRASR